MMTSEKSTVVAFDGASAHVSCRARMFLSHTGQLEALRPATALRASRLVAI